MSNVIKRPKIVSCCLCRSSLPHVVHARLRAIHLVYTHKFPDFRPTHNHCTHKLWRHKATVHWHTQSARPTYPFRCVRTKLMAPYIIEWSNWITGMFDWVLYYIVIHSSGHSKSLADWLHILASHLAILTACTRPYMFCAEVYASCGVQAKHNI